MPTQPPRYFNILLVLTLLSYFIPPKIIPKPYHLIGIIFILFGILINLWTDQLFKKEKTNVKYHKIPRKLIDYGPFKISRNPMYLGMFSILIGTGVLIRSFISFIFPIVFLIIINYKFIPIEEKNMEKKFKSDYIKYKNKVRRWI